LKLAAPPVSSILASLLVKVKVGSFFKLGLVKKTHFTKNNLHWKSVAVKMTAATTVTTTAAATVRPCVTATVTTKATVTCNRYSNCDCYRD
jgi:hypothetical protein